MFSTLVQIWLNDCPGEFKLVYYKQHVHNMFVLFQSRLNIKILMNI